MGLTYTKSFEVQANQCQLFGEIRLSALVHLLMLTSGKQEDDLTETKAFLKIKGYSWVITENVLDIKRLPKYKEQIQITTEAIDYNTFFTYRRYIVKNNQGQELVSVLTTFSLIDLEARKIVRIPEEIVTAYQIEKAATRIQRQRLPKVLEHIDTEKEVTVEFLDIDGNQHVNNGIYLDWISNTLGKDWFASHQLKGLKISYEKEAYLADNITIQTQIVPMTDVKQIYSNHIITRKSNRHCLAQLIWEENK